MSILSRHALTMYLTPSSASLAPPYNCSWVYPNQGGSPPVELCFLFCLYCEDLWLASLFDSRFLTSDGIVRRQALLPPTVAALEAISPNVALPTGPLDTVLGLALTRYFDDCRLVVYNIQLIAPPPRLCGISGWIVDSYRLHCYIKPCELEDEALGTTFSFFEGCRCLYMAKNTLSFSIEYSW
jgi:hypothetical protein